MTHLLVKLTQTSLNTWLLKFVGEVAPNSGQGYCYLTWLIDEPVAPPLKATELQDKELTLDLPFSDSSDPAEIKLSLAVQHNTPEQDFQESQAIPLAQVILRGGWRPSTNPPEIDPRRHIYPVYIPATGQTLTRREAQILPLLAAGATNGAIANQLVVSRNTVKTHLKNIFAKLRVTSRAQAIDRVRELGLL